jgi:two-component system phosphate regulon sensor histidine kinase PhoR
MLGSLRFRTAVAYVLLIVAAFAGLGVYVLDKVEGDFRETIEEDLASQARMTRNLVQPLIEENEPPKVFDDLAKQLGSHAGARITIIAADGTVLGDSEADPATMDNHLNRPEIQEAILSGQGESNRRSATLDSDFTYVATRITHDDAVVGVVRVARPSEAVDASVSDITRSILIAVAATAAAAALLSLIVGSTIMRPLGRLVRAARAIASGDLEQRVSPRPSGEVGELADAFNQMAQSLDDLIAAASQERNRIAAALNSSIDAVLAVDAEGRIAFANLAAERLFFRSQGELVGNPFAWVMPNEQVLDALRASREDSRRGAIVIERPNRQYLQVITTPIVGGGEWAALVVFHDLTDAKRVEQVRRDFVANVSHELRTPLASIKSVLETLQGGAIDDSGTAEDFLSRANAEVDRLAQMVEELLELSRIESGDVPLAQQPVDIGEILAEAVERVKPQADRQGLNLTCVVASDLPPIIGDAARLERAALNLLHNAVKFTSAGGSVEASAAFDGATVTVKVHDTGVGIAPDDLPRVFERFYKADRSRGERGTGLGLAVVKHTVEAHGGTVSVESEPGQGSTFSFSIPAASLPLNR